MPHTIKILPPHLIDQIKAGEVLERPSNLLKELLENAVDANATQIQVEIIDVGMDFLSIKDNGVGINFADLPLAFTRHATSKIAVWEDLFSLSSYGFRGEALASIASVAKLQCRSCQKDGKGGQIQIEGGEIISHLEWKDSSAGTTMVIKDLFYNTPARLKFMKSQISEKNSLKKILHSFILGHPEIHFVIKWDGEKQDFPMISHSEEFTTQRVLPLLSATKKSSVIAQEITEGNNHINLWLVDGQKRNLDFILVNKRLVQDRQIHSVILNALEKYTPAEKNFSYLLHIEVPSDQVDVNVHPGKMQVKFAQTSVILSLVHQALRKMEQPKLQNLVQKDLFSSTIREGSSLNWSHHLTNSTATDPSFHFLHLFNQYYFLFSWEGLFIGHAQNLMHHFLQELFTTPVESIPLLVSEPFSCSNGKIDGQFSYLTSLGLEFDRLSADLIVLRSLPKKLLPLPYKKMIEQWLSKNLEKDFWKNSNLLLHEISTGFVQDFCLQQGKSKLIEQKIIRNISEKDLEHLF